MRRHQHHVAFHAGGLMHGGGNALFQIGAVGGIVEAAFGEHDDPFAAVLVLHGKGADITGAQRINLFCRPFDVLRPDVAAVIEDEVLGAAGNDKLAVQEIAHIAGVHEPVGAHHRRRGFGIAIVAVHHGGAFHPDVADVTLRQRAALGIDDAHLVIRQRAAADDEGAGAMRIGAPGGHGAMAQLHHRAIHGVGAKAAVEIGEGDGQRHFRHAVAGQEGLGAEPGNSQLFGKEFKHVGADHVAADAGDAPCGKVQRFRLAIDAAGGKIVAEGRRIGDGAAPL